MILPVRVIIPTYNRKDSLFRAIESVLHQTLPVNEIIVVIDGGLDLSQELMCRYPSITIIHFDENHGVSFARNTGIHRALCSPGWISFLDSDDFWLPKKNEKQMDWFRSHPEIKVCQTLDIWIRRGVQVNPGLKFKKPEGWIFENCIELCCITPSSVTLLSSVFETIGLFDESLPACEDYDLWLRLSLKYPVGLLDEFLIKRYQDYTDQLSATTPFLDVYRMKALTKLLDQNVLNSEQKHQVTQHLKKLWGIVMNGAKKRGNLELIQFCEEVNKKYGRIDIYWNNQ